MCFNIQRLAFLQYNRINICGHDREVKGLNFDNHLGQANNALAELFESGTAS